jgi:hypothetical protein
VIDEHNSKQIKVLVIFQVVAGSFKVKDGSIVTEGLSMTLDQAGETLSVSYPKHKAYRDLAQGTKYAKSHCNRNGIDGKGEVAFLNLVAHAQAMLNKEMILDAFYHFEIPLPHPCVIAPIVWYPVLGKHNYVSIYVHLSVALVHKQRQIKVVKLQLEDNNAASSQDSEA